MNDDLKTSNVILKELNEKYFVTKTFNPTIPKEGGIEYLVYEEYDNIKMGNFYCKVVKVGTAKKSILFNGRKYNSTGALLEAVEKYNSELPFPARLYDELSNKYHQTYAQIQWYLTEAIGFVKEFSEWREGDSFILKNVYGDAITKLSIAMDAEKDVYDRDTTSGNIIKKTGVGWIYFPFKDAEDAVSVINSIVSGEVIPTFNDLFEILSKMRGNFSNLDNAKYGDLQDFLNGTQKKYTEFIIPKLEELLVKLKENAD